MLSYKINFFSHQQKIILVLRNLQYSRRSVTSRFA